MVNVDEAIELTGYKLWSEMVCEEIEKDERLKDYCWDKDRCCTVLYNQWGTYSDVNLPVVYEKESVEGEYLNGWLLNVGLEYCNNLGIRRFYFKEFINTCYRILSHMIPKEGTLIIDLPKIENVCAYYEKGKDRYLLKDAYIYGVYVNDDFTLIDIRSTSKPIMEEIRKYYEKVKSRGDISFKILFESHNGIRKEELDYIEQSFKHILGLKEETVILYGHELASSTLDASFLNRKLDKLVDEMDSLEHRMRDIQEELGLVRGDYI